MISQYYYMPIAKAAKAFNVGLTVFKRRCRELGIQRWPHRKLKSIQLLISTLQAENGGAKVDKNTQEIITRLEEEKRRVEENPNSKLARSTKRLRQCYFKSRYKRRKTMSLVLSLTKPATPSVATQLQYSSHSSSSYYEDIEDGYGVDCSEQD